MKTSITLSFCLVIFPLYASSAESYPKDVEKFIERRDLCDHFRTEDPYDEERKIELQKNAEKFCTGSDKQLFNLKKKYNENFQVMKKLNEYDEKIELLE
jgi:hypothetical protein